MILLYWYRVVILKKNYLWLLPFYMVVATYFYYEKVHRTMRTAIVSNLLNRKQLDRQLGTTSGGCDREDK